MARPNILFLALALASSVAHPSEECKVEQYADLPVTMAGTRPIIAGSINGVDAHFAADSGSFYSAVSRESADKFHLTLQPLPWGMDVRSFAGMKEARQATAKDFSLAGFGTGAMHSVDFIVDNGTYASGVDGEIGQTILGNADAEYDLAHGSIRLFRVKGCHDVSLAYWHGTAPVAVIDIDRTSPMSPHLIGKARLNGSPISAMFDSGLSRSALDLKAAMRAGFKRDDPNVLDGGALFFGPGKSGTWIARFDMLDLGGEQIKHALLRVGNIDLGIGVDMLLGADFFLSHRLFVANSQHKIYFTYNGGQVFDLSVKSSTPTGAPAVTDKPASTAGAAVSADEPTDAPGYRRRGAASAGRGDLRSALADLNEAVKRDPGDAENYYQRGLARWRDHQAVLAMSDFDQALKISPAHIDALASRGSLRLQSKDKEGAAADFAAAIGKSPTDAILALDVAQIYVRDGYYPESIDRLDSWIAAHPKDDRLAFALNERCWARAMLGQALDQALEDCNAALKKDPHSSEAIDSRGLVWLRLGDLDHAIADYEAAIKLQPKRAWSLYGLGLAELKKGQQEKGNQHLQEAIAVNPQIAAEFKKLGLAP